MKALGTLLGSISLLLFSVLIVGCGGSEDDTQGTTLSFRITSADLDCSSSKDIKVNAPYAGKTYNLTVEASPETIWSASVGSGNLVTVTPTGEQQGNGTIQIVVSANPEKEEGRSGTVIIKNNADDIPLRIAFDQKEKELYIPEGSEGQTREQFNNPTSKYNVHYMKQGDNVAIFWERTLGLNPPTTGGGRKFDPDKVLKAAEETHAFLIDELGFANRTTSNANKYKQLIFVRDNDEGTAYGGGDNNVGKLWVSPLHLQNERFGILYHEMCHCFQTIAKFDGAASQSGPVHEMTSQWALLRRFPNWLELESGHFNEFMKYTHLALGHEENGYHSPYVLEYWAYKNGVNMVSRVWKEAITADNSDFIATYIRLAKITQAQFNDEMYDAATRFVTWDLPHIKDAYAKNGINKHTCKLKQTSPGGNTYQITSERCPQNYGYNGILLNVPTAGSKVTLSFTGLSSADGFNIVRPSNAGWRYGFLALKNNGERVYGEMGDKKQGSLIFTIPEETKYLWLVVTGAPTEHWKHVVDGKFETDNQWPYQFTLLGTTPHSSVL